MSKLDQVPLLNINPALAKHLPFLTFVEMYEFLGSHRATHKLRA